MIRDKISLARPFAALRPRPETAAAVIAPPYDVVDTDEARELAAGKPESFLHISRPEIDLPDGTDPYSDAVYSHGAASLERLIAQSVLERDATPCYYAYRMTMGAHRQTGIALAASIAAYEAGRIHRHELTRPDKENDRVRNIETLNAQTGPVMLAYKASERLDGALATVTKAPPLLAAEGQHGVVHEVWRIDDAEHVTALSKAIDALGDLYIADGHHRSAAASRVAASRRAAGAAEGGNHEYFLSVAFPDDQMKIYDYNRVVADLNGLDADGFVAAVGKVFKATPSDALCKPSAPRTYAMYVAGRWYALEAPPAASGDDPVARLDVSVLQRQLIEPILGVGDPRTDPRINFVGGVRGLEELERRVDSGRAAVAFALYPTSMADLMAVADADLLMPPKSTWFEPKLADGLLSHVLD
ncbi:MAG: DUF1015 family protein [Gammaproteobacteria bacterium]|nr:DUF1015 family protein [Gammaproteobacteria bacterium]